MAFITVSTAAWPVVLSTAWGTPTRAQHAAYLDEWRTWFARGERFAVLRHFADEASLAHPDGAARDTKRWLSGGAGDAIRRQVVAMVNVVPETALPGMVGMSIEKVFGIPGMIGDDMDAALRWLARTAPFPVDPNGVARRLRNLAKPDGQGGMAI